MATKTQDPDVYMRIISLRSEIKIRKQICKSTVVSSVRLDLLSYQIQLSQYFTNVWEILLSKFGKWYESIFIFTNIDP